MRCSSRSRTAFVAATVLVTSLATSARAQSPQYPKPTELPNPYRLVEGWPTLPASMMAAVGVRSSGFMSTATATFGSSIAASTPCRPASPPVSAAAMPIRRSCNLIPPAGCSRASAPACLSIHTGSRSTTTAICGSAISMTKRQSSVCQRATPLAPFLDRKFSSSTRTVRF